MAKKIGGAVINRPDGSLTIPKFDLSAIEKVGGGGRPTSVLLYGPQKSYKTTMCAKGLKDAVFVLTEDGTGRNRVDAFPLAETYEQILAAVNTLIESEHNFKVLVIDTLDRLERLLFDYVSRNNGVSSIEKVGGGWAKGYREAEKEINEFLAKLEKLVAQGMSVVMIGHSKIANIDDPSASASYQRNQLDLHDRVSGPILDWVDAILFVHQKLHFREGEDVRAIKGDLVLEPTGGPGWSAGNRWGVRDSIPATPEAFGKLLDFAVSDREFDITF